MIGVDEKKLVEVIHDAFYAHKKVEILTTEDYVDCLYNIIHRNSLNMDKEDCRILFGAILEHFNIKEKEND